MSDRSVLRVIDALPTSPRVDPRVVGRTVTTDLADLCTAVDIALGVEFDDEGSELSPVATMEFAERLMVALLDRPWGPRLP